MHGDQGQHTESNAGAVASAPAGAVIPRASVGGLHRPIANYTGLRVPFGTGESLEDIVARCALPIRVQPSFHGEAIWISQRGPDGIRHVARHLDSADATRAYLSLCRSLSTEGA